MLADYRISVDTNINTDKLDAFEKKIKALDGKQLDIKVHVDTANIGSQVTKQISKAIGVGSGSKGLTINPNIQFDSNDIAKRANSVFKGIQNQVIDVNMDITSVDGYMNNLKDIQSQIKTINRLSVNPDVNSERLKEAESYLNKLVKRKNSADSVGIFGLDNLDMKQLKDFAAEVEKTEYAISDIKARSIDLGIADAAKQESAEAQAEFKRLSKLYDSIFTNEKRKLNINIGDNELNDIEKNISSLKQEADSLLNSMMDSGRMSDKMITALSNKENFQTSELSRLSAKNVDLGIADAAKKEAAEAQAEFQRLNKLLDSVFAGNKRKLSNNIGDTELAALDKNITKLQQEANSLFDSMVDSGRMTDEMFSDLADKSMTQASELSRLKAKNIDLGIADAAKKEAADVKSTFAELKGYYNDLYSLQKKQVGLDTKSSQYQQIEARIKSLKATIDSTFDSISPKMTTSMFDELAKDAEKAGYSIEELKSKMSDAFVGKINDGSIEREYTQIENRIQKLGSNMTSGLQNSFSSLTSLKKECTMLSSAYEQGAVSADLVISKQKEYESVARSVSNQLSMQETAQRNLNNEMKAAQKNQAFLNKQQNALLDAEIWKQNHSAAIPAYGEQLDYYMSAMKNATNEVDFSNAQAGLRGVQKEAQLAGKAVMNFGDRLKTQAREYASYIGVAGAIATGVQAFKAMYQNVLDVDTAMTGLYRVTDLTSKQYDALYDDMIASSKEYGATLTDTINATSDWVRAGFDANTALGLADVTAMYQHVADLDYDEASKNLLTAYKGFEQNFTQNFGTDVTSAVEHVADVYNELDNKFSVTSAGLGESLARSASALQLAGNTFEEATALAGAATEVNQDPEKTGTALKTLSLRIRGMKGELEELGEDSEGVENISQMQGRILNMTKGAVNIFDNNGDFKSTYEIMKGIAEIYDDLSSTDQAELLETIAGKNHANTVAGLISNFDTAIEMNEAALNSEGSAARENEKYIDSLQGRIDVLTSSIQALSNSALDSGFLKGGVSGITALIDGFTSLIDTAGLFPTVIGAGTVALTLFGKGFAKIDFSNGTNQLKLFGKTIDEIKTIASTFNTSGGIDAVLQSFGDKAKDPFEELDKQLAIDKAAIDNYKNLMARDDKITVQDAMDRSFAGASDGAKQYAQSMNAAKLSSDEYVSSARNIEIANRAQSNSFKDGLYVLKQYNKMSTESRTAMASSQEVAGTSVGKYMSSLNGAEASLGGFIKSTVASKGAQLALNAAVGLGAGALMTLGSMALDFVIGKLIDFVNRAENVKKAVGDATTSFEAQKEEISKNQGSFDDAVASYDKLSSGIDKITGKNISLSSDEYEEYANAVNTIASMTPSLVQGYDAQGNAILNATANVESLTKAYNELIIAENNKLLNGDGEDYKGLSDISENLNNELKKLESDQTITNGLNKVLGESNITKETVLSDMGATIQRDAKEVAKAMESANKTIEGVGPTGLFGNFASNDEAAEYIAAVAKQYPEIVRGMVTEFDSALDNAVEPMRDAMSAHLENALLGGDYSNLDDSSQEIVKSIVDGIDSATISELQRTGGDSAVMSYVDNIANAFNNMGESELEQIKDSFNLGNLFQSGEMSLGEYRKQLDKAKMLLDKSGLDEKVQTQIEVSLNMDEVQGEWQSFVNRMTESGMEYGFAVDFANSLDASEWAAAQQLVVNGEIDWKDKTPEEIMDEIEKLSALNDALNFTIDITAETDSIDAMNTALSEMRSSTGLTQDSISALESRYAELDGANYDSAKLFEETANGIRLNTEEFNRLEDAYATSKMEELNGNLSTLKNRYDELGVEIQNCSDINERAKLYGEQEEIRAQINNLAELGAAYEGLTSQYKAWEDAESAGTDRDMYESILSGFEEIDDEISRGWLDDATKEFIKLMSPENMSFDSIDAYIDRWNQLDDKIKGTTYSVRDFFTQNEDGESTNNGVYNFLDAVSQLNDSRFKIEKNANGVITSFDFGVNGDKAVAEAMGISEELVQIIERAAEDAGFVINMNGAFTQLADLQNRAEEAAQTLRDMGKTDYYFDFDTTSLDSLEEQLTEAKSILDQFKNEDGTIKSEFINADGSFTEDAQAAIDVMSTLTAMADKLSEPTYMQLDTSQVDESLQDTLSDLQNYESLVKQKHQLEITGADTSEIDAAMDEIAQKIYDNDDLKAKLSIDPNASIDDIKKQIEAGEIEIPATIDIQTQMDEKLNDIRLLLMNQAGLLSDTELKLAFELDTTALDSYTPEEKDAVVNFLADTKDVDNYTPEQKQAIAKYIKDVSDVESWTPEEKKAVCDFIVNNEDVMSYTPEEKDAIARYMLDTSSVDSFTLKDQEAVAKFIAEHGDVDAWNPEDKKAIAKFLVDSSDVDKYEAEDKQGTAIYSVDDDKIRRWKPETKNGIAIYTPKLSSTKLPTLNGTANYTVTTSSSKVSGHVYGQSTKVNGTAHANGTAFKQGNWGAKDSGTAIMGELGPEIIVRGDKWFTVGDDGAGFYQYKNGDIIFNHKFLFVALLRNK